MECLPEEIQTTICKEAVPMHAVQRRIRKCIGPFFAVWVKHANYERRWPGSSWGIIFSIWAAWRKI